MVQELHTEKIQNYTEIQSEATKTRNCQVWMLYKFPFLIAFMSLWIIYFEKYCILIFKSLIKKNLE